MSAKNYATQNISSPHNNNIKTWSSTEKLIVLIYQPKFVKIDLITYLLPLSQIEEAVCKDSCRSITLCNSWKKIWQTTNKKFSITPPYVIVHLLSERKQYGVWQEWVNINQYTDLLLTSWEGSCQKKY